MKSLTTCPPAYYAGTTHTAAAAAPLTSSCAAGPAHAADGSRSGACNCQATHGSHTLDELNGRNNADASNVFSHALRSSNEPDKIIQTRSQ